MLRLSTSSGTATSCARLPCAHVSPGKKADLHEENPTQTLPRLQDPYPVAPWWPVLALHDWSGEVSAAVAKLPVPAAAPSEPTTLKELYVQARKDLEGNRQNGVLLMWTFWHAKAMGRLKVAEIQHGKLAQQDRDVHLLMNSQFSQSLKDVIAQEMTPVATLRQAEEMLVEATAYVEATRAVVKLLEVK